MAMKATYIWEIFFGFTVLKEPYIHITDKWNFYTRAYMKCNTCWKEWDKVWNQKPSCSNCSAFFVKKIDKWDYYELALSNGWYTKVDKDDFDKISNTKWYLTKRHSIESRRWNKLVKLHRVIMNAPQDFDVDHVNWDILDNRKSNLRLCTKTENMRNTKKRKWTTSIYKWVHWSNSKKSYIWMIWLDAKHLKCKSKIVKTELEWALWYDEMAELYFWEFSRTNKRLWLL